MNYIDKLKKLRKKILIKTIIIYSILSIMFFLPMILIIKESKSLDYLKIILLQGFIVFIFGKFLSYDICSNDIEKYKKIYAKNITLVMLQNTFKDVKYVPTDELLPKDFAIVIDNAKIPTINSYLNDDYISAKYKNIEFEYSDIIMKYIPKNSDSNDDESFKGKWLVLTFKENFKSNIQIGPKIFNGKKNKQMLKGEEYKEIKTKDIYFDKKLIMYADKDEEVFNILTPDKIEKIKKLYKETNGKIFLFFLNNKIHIGIGDKKNFFEPTIYKKFNLESEKKKILNQINIIIDLINYLI